MVGESLSIRLHDPNRDSPNQLEFVQYDKLAGDFPHSLLYKTIILFNDELKRLEFYPSRSGWDVSRMGNPQYIMSLEMDPSQEYFRPKLIAVSADPTIPSFILCPASDVVQNLSKLLRPLEELPINLRVAWKPANDAFYLAYNGFTLDISLPRYKLSFFIGTQGHFESRELIGLSISPSQIIGTLLGPDSKLILDSKEGNATRQNVIVPSGVALHSWDGVHPRVLIDIPQDAGKLMHVHVYEVDHILKRLVPDATLKSWYQLAYLHILTSSHQLDPLLLCNGLEYGLHMLRSAYSYGFSELGEEGKEILGFILNLCPVRLHFPRHIEIMESVSWNPNLSPLSQSDVIARIVEAILVYAQDQAVFYSPKKTKKK